MNVPFFDQRLERTIEQYMAVGEFTPASTRRKTASRAALNIDPAVLARRSGQIVEARTAPPLRAMIAWPSALIIRARSWNVSCAALVRRPRGVRQHPAEIEPTEAGRRHRRAIDRARISARLPSPAIHRRARSSTIAGSSFHSARMWLARTIWWLLDSPPSTTSAWPLT